MRLSSACLSCVPQGSLAARTQQCVHLNSAECKRNWKQTKCRQWPETASHAEVSSTSCVVCVNLPNPPDSIQPTEFATDNWPTTGATTGFRRISNPRCVPGKQPDSSRHSMIYCNKVHFVKVQSTPQSVLKWMALAWPAKSISSIGTI